MKFKKVNKQNINTLYKLNKHLAIKEGQKELFSASKKEYKKAFLSKNPLADAVVAYKNNKPIGFIIYNYKLATYLAKKVLYIEDIFLDDKNYTKKNIQKLFKYIDKKSKKNCCCRVEIRILKNYSMDMDILKKQKFLKIEKWDIYRYGT